MNKKIEDYIGREVRLENKDGEVFYGILDSTKFDDEFQIVGNGHKFIFCNFQIKEIKALRFEEDESI